MNKPLISKTAALKTARAAVGMPVGSQTSYQVTGPYYDAQPHGPSTTIQRDSYANAMVSRRYWIARIALALMGYALDDIAYDLDDVNVCDQRSITGLIDSFMESHVIESLGGSAS